MAIDYLLTSNWGINQSGCGSTYLCLFFRRSDAVISVFFALRIFILSNWRNLKTNQELLYELPKYRKVTLRRLIIRGKKDRLRWPKD